MEVSNFKSQAFRPPRVFRSGLALFSPLPYYLSPLLLLQRLFSHPFSALFRPSLPRAVAGEVSASPVSPLPLGLSLLPPPQSLPPWQRVFTCSRIPTGILIRINAAFDLKNGTVDLNNKSTGSTRYRSTVTVRTSPSTDIMLGQTGIAHDQLANDFDLNNDAV